MKMLRSPLRHRLRTGVGHRRVRLGGCLAAGAVLALTSGVAAIAPANAASSSTLLTTQIRANSPNWVPVTRLPAKTITGGSKMYFYGKYSATSLHPKPVMLRAQVNCVSATGSAKSVWSTLNNVGGAEFIAVRALLTMPTTGSYTCTLEGGAERAEVTDATPLLRVDSATLSMLDDPQAAGLQWDDGAVDPTTGEGGETESALKPTVTAGTSHYFLRRNYTPATAATTISLRVDAGVNNPDKGSSGKTSNVTGTLYAIQLDRTMTKACAVPGSEVTSQKTLNVTPGMHHAKLYMNLTGVPINTSTECSRVFAVKLLISAGPDGAPVEILDNRYSVGIALSGSPGI